MTYDKSQPNRGRVLQGRKVPISTYVEVELYDGIIALARKNERPVAAEIRLAMREHVERAAA